MSKLMYQTAGSRIRPLNRSSWPRQTQNVPKWARVLLRSLILVCAILGLRRGLADLHDQFVKRIATDFSNLDYTDRLETGPENPIRFQRESWIDDRYVYVRHLGHGAEGSADLYSDHKTQQLVVIKTVHGSSRNRIPDESTRFFSTYTEAWPTEIEAALRLKSTAPDGAYMPLLDYFILEHKNDWTWALVSPFSAKGTLVSLVAKDSIHGAPVAQLDQQFRPAFDKLVAALKPLHDAGLCHDDIKPDNIFVNSVDEWLVGDVGNVREISHPWHRTRSWRRQNQWRDCRANDIRRLIKSYLWFLRGASGPEAFDVEFWQAAAEWSRLYWEYAESQGYGKKSSQTPSDVRGATERELLCTTIPWMMWKPWWFLTFWL